MNDPNPLVIALLEAGIDAADKMLAQLIELNKESPLALWPGVFMEGKANLQKLLADYKAGRVTGAEAKARLQAMIDNIQAAKNNQPPPTDTGASRR